MDHMIKKNKKSACISLLPELLVDYIGSYYLPTLFAQRPNTLSVCLKLMPAKNVLKDDEVNVSSKRQESPIKAFFSFLTLNRPKHIYIFYSSCPVWCCRWKDFLSPLFGLRLSCLFLSPVFLIPPKSKILPLRSKVFLGVSCPAWFLYLVSKHVFVMEW